MSFYSWVFYEDKAFSGNLFVLSEGDYPNVTSMGCLPDFAIRSVKAVPMVRARSPYKRHLLSPRLPLNLRLSLSRPSQSPPSLCSASSVWRAERSPWRRRSSAWWKRASTTTSCLSESTAAGECLRRMFGLVQLVCLRLFVFCPSRVASFLASKG